MEQHKRLKVFCIGKNINLKSFQTIDLEFKLKTDVGYEYPIHNPVIFLSGFLLCSEDEILLTWVMRRKILVFHLYYKKD